MKNSDLLYSWGLFWAIYFTIAKNNNNSTKKYTPTLINNNNDNKMSFLPKWSGVMKQKIACIPPPLECPIPGPAPPFGDDEWWWWRWWRRWWRRLMVGGGGGGDGDGGGGG
jgi:hypothetical protein